MKIAKSSGDFLDIGLQMKNGVPVFVMTFPGHLNQVGQQGLAFLAQQARQPDINEELINLYIVLRNNVEAAGYHEVR